MKRYVVFAGVNGAGKTTLFQTNESYQDLPRVNVDELVRSIGSWKNQNDVLKAGIIAVQKIKQYFEEEISFNQESTLCGQSIIKNIIIAKKLGYIVDLNYVGLESVDLAIERVKKRVESGGHGIPEEDIRRRYFESLKNLQKIIPLCDYVRVYDNTKSFKKIATFINGICVDKADEIPEWFKDIFDKTGE